jgi:hypothetical protein
MPSPFSLVATVLGESVLRRGESVNFAPTVRVGDFQLGLAEDIDDASGMRMQRLSRANLMLFLTKEVTRSSFRFTLLNANTMPRQPRGDQTLGSYLRKAKIPKSAMKSPTGRATRRDAKIGNLRRRK